MQACLTRLRPGLTEFSGGLTAQMLELNCRRNCMTAIQKRGFASKELINTRRQYNCGASPRGLPDFPRRTSVKSTVLFLSAELHDNNSTVRLRPTSSCKTRLRPGLTEFYSEDFQRRDRNYYCRRNCTTLLQLRLRPPACVCDKSVNSSGHLVPPKELQKPYDQANTEALPHVAY